MILKDGAEVSTELFDGPPSVLELDSDWIIPLHPLIPQYGSRKEIFTLEMSHPNYPAIPAHTSAFNVTICGGITAMIPPAIEWDEFVDYNIMVGEPVGISIGTYIRNGDPDQVCLETLTFSPSLDRYLWISVDDRTVIVESSDPLLAGMSFSFSVTSTLNDLLPTSDSSVTFSVSF